VPAVLSDNSFNRPRRKGDGAPDNKIRS
jgi:hypothetical protein